MPKNSPYPPAVAGPFERAEAAPREAARVTVLRPEIRDRLRHLARDRRQGAVVSGAGKSNAAMATAYEV